VVEQAKRNVHSILETLSGKEGRGERERERNVPWILFRAVRATKISSFRTFNVPKQYLSSVYIPSGKHLKYREQLVSQERRRYFAQQSRKRISTVGCTFMCRWRPIFFCFRNIFQCHKACHAGHVYCIVSGSGCIFARPCECHAREFHLIPAESVRIQSSYCRHAARCLKSIPVWLFTNGIMLLSRSRLLQLSLLHRCVYRGGGNSKE